MINRGKAWQRILEFMAGNVFEFGVGWTVWRHGMDKNGIYMVFSLISSEKGSFKVAVGCASRGKYIISEY